MQQTQIPVKELVDNIERGVLRLPEMQRRYVWPATRVRDLLDSLYRGYPAGTILVWETDEQTPSRDMAVAQQASPFRAAQLLLDGQQRLTSLSAAIRGEPIKVRWRKKPIDILFNLEHPHALMEVLEVEDDENGAGEDYDEEENGNGDTDIIDARLQAMAFVVASRRLAAHPNWVSVTEVFKTASDGPFLKKAGVADFDDPRYLKYTERLKALRDIKNYKFTMQVLGRDLSYEEVTEIFVRVNSLGAKLRAADLAMAQITAKWRNSLVLFEEFQQDCVDHGFDLPLGLLVRGLMIHATGQCRFNALARLDLGELQKAWEKTKEAVRFSADFLKSNAMIEDPVLLSSGFFVLTTGYFAAHKDYKLDPTDEKDYLYWLHIANARGHYSGSAETKLDQDLATIRTDGNPSGLIERLKGTIPRLHFEASDFQGRIANSGLFKLMYIALKAKGAKDWGDRLAVSLRRQGQKHQLQYHHIFPKAYLAGRYPPRMLNEITNMAFISGRTNRRIGKKAPADYIPPIIAEQGEEAFESQCIPLDEAMLTHERFEDFLASRRELLAKAVTEFTTSLRT